MQIKLRVDAELPMSNEFFNTYRKSLYASGQVRDDADEYYRELQAFMDRTTLSDLPLGSYATSYLFTEQESKILADDLFERTYNVIEAAELLKQGCVMSPGERFGFSGDDGFKDMYAMSSPEAGQRTVYGRKYDDGRVEWLGVRELSYLELTSTDWKICRDVEHPDNIDQELPFELRRN